MRRNVIRFFSQKSRNVAFKSTSSVAAAGKTAEEEFRTGVESGSGSLKDDEWSKIRNRIMSAGRFYNKVNVDATILGLCNKHGDMEVGRSYMRFLEKKQIPVTAAIAGKYLKLFNLEAGEVSLNEELSKEILQICSDIQAKHPVLDGNTAENLIHGLCLTEEWGRSLKLLDSIKEFGSPSHAPFNNIAQAAFRHNDSVEGIRQLEDGIAGNRLPSAASLIAWIHSNSPIEKLLDFLQIHNLQVPESVATALKSHLEQSENIHVDLASVSRNKICGSCKSPLDEISMDAAEFKMLQDAFYEKVLIKENIFIKSTPQEFNEFQGFLDRTGPFDCVIDGLNVAYSVGSNKPVNSLSGHILAAMKYFTQEKKRVLILGREHMKRWPGFLKRVETNNGQAFLTENLSQDDPFFIHAALQSGPSCDIFSRDLLRTHAHQLGPELGPIFRRWQRIHQYSYKSPTTSTTPKLFVQPPVKYKIEAHKNSSGMWHVPWTEEGSDYMVNRIPEVPFEVPVRWLCFRLRRS